MSSDGSYGAPPTFAPDSSAGTLSSPDGNAVFRNPAMPGVSRPGDTPSAESGGAHLVESSEEEAIIVESVKARRTTTGSAASSRSQSSVSFHQ